MALTPCPEDSAASWIVRSPVAWQRMVRLGPAGLPAYARLRFLPDPTGPGQAEGSVPPRPGAATAGEQIRAALGVLARYTRTPQECYFCLWDGWGLQPGSQPGRPGAHAATVTIPHRTYHLFRGTWADVGDWGPLGPADGSPVPAPEPAFVWPADRAWCLARDVDPHDAGIGAARAAVDALVRDADLDVVPVDPEQPQPRYG